MKKTLLSLVLFAVALSAAANVVHRPGLVQAQFRQPSDHGFKTQTTGVPVLASNLVAVATAAELDFTPSVFMDYSAGDGPGNRTNPISGKAWGWPQTYIVFAYEGEIRLEAGTKIQCYGRFDDGEALVIDGKTVVHQGASSGYDHNPSVATSFTAPRTGWFPFNAWVWDWTGGKNVCGAVYALQWNTNGVTGSQSDSSQWFRFEDPLDMSFLRSTTGEAFTTVGTVAKNGDDLDVSLVFAGLPSGASLAACFGSADGGTAATSDWQRVVSLGSVATNDTGTSTLSVSVPGAASATAIRFFLEGEKGTIGYFTEWTEPVSLRSDPIVEMGGVVPSYTNGVATVVLRAMGLDVSENALTLEIAATETGFDDPVATFAYPANPATSVGRFEIPFTGLVTNTTYWARAVAANGGGGRGVSAPVSFTMLEPGFATGVLSFRSAGFSALSFTGAVTDWGADSSSAELFLDVSPSEEFPEDSTLSFPGPAAVSGGLPALQVLDATGLEGDTPYFARLRIVNTWGLETAVPLAGSFPTLATPVAMSEPSAVASGSGTETLSIAALVVEPGTTYSVILEVDGGSVATWTDLSAAESFSFSWSDPPGKTHAAAFVVSASNGGRTFGSRYGFSFTVGSRVQVLGSLAELDSTFFRVGDRFVVPALGVGESLSYDTNAVVSADGLAFTAAEPGACRLRRYSADPVTGAATQTETGVAIVLPREEDVKGGLFVRRTGSGDFTWRSRDSWEKISGKGEWPDGPDDIAFVYLPLTGDMSVQLGNADVTLGHLGAGSTLDYKTMYFRNGAVTFRTSDGSESRLSFSGRTGGNSPLVFDRRVTLLNDLALDGMGQDVMSCYFSGGFDIGPHTLRTTRVPRYGSNGKMSGGQIQFRGDLIGTGTVLHDANATTSLRDTWGTAPRSRTLNFTGTWDYRNGSHDNEYGGAGLFLGGTHLADSAELAVRGAWMADTAARRGANVRTGWSNGYQNDATTNWFDAVLPRKVTLDGGRLQLITEGPIDSKYKDGIREDWYVTGEFRLATGPMGSLWSGISTWHDGCYPNSHAIFTNLVVEPGATASFSLDTSANRNYGAISNDFHVVNAPAAAWDSGKGYEILPFFFPNAESNNRYVVVRDTATGRVKYVSPDSTASSTGNIRELGSNGRNDPMEDGSTWEAVTVYPWAYGYFARTNSTVRILSGYLDVVSTQFAPPNHANSASSTVDFGDRPAYVYVNSQSYTAAIGCRVKGTGGFVKSAGGTLTLHRPMDALTGGVWVGCGRLSLLDDATLGENDVFVAAGAKLRIAGGDPFGTNARLDLEDRDWIGVKSKLELDSGETCHVRRLYVSGENRHRGYYGSSEAEPAMAALATVGFPVFVDDEMFSGPGILKVKGDDLLQPALMILR